MIHKIHGFNILDFGLVEIFRIWINENSAEMAPWRTVDINIELLKKEIENEHP